ncbi:hypothetical protein N657DRAFT_421154 [Parathielavia appendiculata]|uniref:Uncharacterized protein n=1 Tax=Parathielavia appendiculata TaxID=2587402 RepID=A0AAN6U013_9PEZI|nr:hypothetical protein N657DRAFT_421154 [Parathielavia appendiculata]
MTLFLTPKSIPPGSSLPLSFLGLISLPLILPLFIRRQGPTQQVVADHISDLLRKAESKGAARAGLPPVRLLVASLVTGQTRHQICYSTRVRHRSPCSSVALPGRLSLFSRTHILLHSTVELGQILIPTVIATLPAVFTQLPQQEGCGNSCTSDSHRLHDLGLKPDISIILGETLRKLI